MGMMYSKGLVAGYSFENTANDIMGVNNGTVYGATYVDGQCGRALSFDGVDDYVDLGTTIYCPTNSAWSVSLRFKIPSGTLPTFGGLFSLKSANFNFSSFYSTDATYKLAFGYLNGSQGKATATLPSRDVYHHCVIVYGGNAATMYIDTVLQNTSAVPFAIQNSNNFIGKYLGNPSKSIIENFQIFNRALNVNEIKRLYLNLGI